MLSHFGGTPLHPQWLIYIDDRVRLAYVAAHSRGVLLDIGCADQPLRPYLSGDINYIGLDYPGTVDTMYHTKPDIFGDGQDLPVKSDSIDTVALLEVLEHVPDPASVLAEISRVLKPGGKCFLSMPFLYPIHDAPHDFQRLTIFGLRKLIHTAGFRIELEKNLGNPVKTSMILLNLALSRTVLRAYEKKHPALLLGVLLPVVIPFCNAVGWLLEKTGPDDSFMPHGYLLRIAKVPE